MEDTLEMGDEEIPVGNHYPRPTENLMGRKFYTRSECRDAAAVRNHSVLFADHSVDRSLISFIVSCLKCPGTGKTVCAKRWGRNLLFGCLIPNGASRNQLSLTLSVVSERENLQVVERMRTS